MAKFDGYEHLKNVTTNERSYALEFVWYPSSTNPDCMSDWLEAASNIRQYFSAWHNNDLKDDGTPAEPHMHTVIYFKHQTDEVAVARWLVRTCCPAFYPYNPNGIRKFALWGDIRDAVRYLLHLDQPEKYQYEHLDPNYSSDLHPKWIDTPLYQRSLKNHASDNEASRKTRSILAILDVIHEQNLMTFTELICACKDDSQMIRAIRENPYLIRQLLNEACDCSVKWSKCTNNGIIPDVNQV